MFSAQVLQRETCRFFSRDEHKRRVLLALKQSFILFDLNFLKINLPHNELISYVISKTI